MSYRSVLQTIASLLFVAQLLQAQAVVGAASSTPLGVSTNSQVEKRPLVSTEDYVIGVDDILAINVWKEPDLSRTLPVRPDGKITLPLLGDVQAAGKTPTKLQQELHDSLAVFVAVPEVAVIVQEVKSLKFNIVGQVAKPGSYSLSESMTVLDAIAQAGGLGIGLLIELHHNLRVPCDSDTI